MAEGWFNSLLLHNVTIECGAPTARESAIKEKQGKQSVLT